MSTHTVSYLLVLSGFVVLLAGTIRYGMRITLADIASDALMATGWALAGSRLAAALFAALGAWQTWLWWKNDDRRGRRRKALASLGAKSRAIRDAIARKARENARPSPVRKPVRGGAR